MYLAFVLVRQNVSQQNVPEPSGRVVEMYVCVGHRFDEHCRKCDTENAAN